jgi:hypothetical protein
MLERQEAEAAVAERKRRDEFQAPNTRPESELIWNFFGLRVGRKTEIIALVAFVLSVSGVLWQVFNFTRGAVVQLFPSDQIVVTAVNRIGRNYSGQDNLLALIASMSYANDGEVGHNAIIRREYISLSFGGRQVEHRWYEFGSSDVQEANVFFKRESDARPFPVIAGSAASHETLFTAWEVDCDGKENNCDPATNFVKWDEFLTAVKANNRLLVTTKASIYPKRIVTASCEVRLRKWEIEILEKEQWLAATCNETGANAQSQRKAAAGRPAR